MSNAAQSLREPPLDFGESLPSAEQPAKSDRQPSYIKDHRKRLRSRFLNGGADALPDYELLELVLFLAIPRSDVKPIAWSLLEEFDDFNGVLSADPSRLQEIRDVGPFAAQTLKLMEAVGHRFMRSKVIGRPAVSGWEQLVTYCHARMAHQKTEQFRVLYLDRKNVLIADEEQGQGTVDHVPVYPREVLKRALELGASALILVHNHPSGDATPSAADISMTKTIEHGAQALGLTLHDHLIIGKSKETSLRAAGYL